MVNRIESIEFNCNISVSIIGDGLSHCSSSNSIRIANRVILPESLCICCSTSYNPMVSMKGLIGYVDRSNVNINNDRLTVKMEYLKSKASEIMNFANRSGTLRGVLYVNNKSGGFKRLLKLIGIDLCDYEAVYIRLYDSRDYEK